MNPRHLLLVPLVFTGLVLWACGGERGRVPAGVPDPDRLLFERASEALKEEHWLAAREDFRLIVDNYPQSPHRAEAKLGVGDSFLGEGTTEALVLAINEFREFLTFYPTHARADYAQYKLGMAYAKQMLGADRDQTNTREAIKEFDVFVERYPNSPLLAEVKDQLRQAKDRLSESEYRVGLFYFRIRWYVGAIDRFKKVLKDDPGFTRRDAVYFHLAESLFMTDQKAEALPYYERLISEFVSSEFLAEAQKRVAELRGA